ncbi:MAG TPA: serine hydrolase [Terracidiphilus sp.]|jgi:CubicO group peptidase (beta-lactamase class C family)
MAHRFMIAVAAFICLSVLSGDSIAQTRDEAATKARLDQIANSYTPNNAFMGTVLVVEGDQIILDKAYGMASLEWQVPNSTDTKFRIGSITKQFTSTLILLLQQDGKLDINHPVSKYMPDSPPAWAKITLANLLGHTSGIPSFTGFKEFRAWSMMPHTPQEEIAFFRDRPLDFEPGSKFDYSNSNFILLGALVEKVSGRKYATLLRERILDPLGMKDTGLDSDEIVLPRRAEGYSPGPNGLEVARSESMTIPFSAGAIYSTTGDLLKWEHGLFGGKILNADSLKLMTTPGKGNYGLGVFIADQDGVRVVSHGGGIEGFNTHLAYAPERQIAVIVFSNVNGSAPDAMGGQLMDTMLGKKVVLAGERKAVPIEKDKLARFAGVFDLAPTFSITVAVSGDHVTAQGTGQPALELMYQGERNGHPLFFAPVPNAEIEFVPDASGAITSLILHQGGQDIPGKKH